MGWTSQARRAESTLQRQQASNKQALRCGREGRKPRASLYLGIELGLELEPEEQKMVAAPTLSHGIHGQLRSAGMTTQGLPTLDPQLRDSTTLSLCCYVHRAWQSNVETAPGSDQLYEGHTGPSKLSHG